MRYQRFAKTKSMGEIIRAGVGEGVEVARVAVHQLTTVLCLSALAVIIAVPRLLLNTMVIFAAYLLPASAFWVMVYFVMITVLITVLFGLPTLCSMFALAARHVTFKCRSGNQCTEPLCDNTGFVLAVDLILELLRWQRVIVNHLTVLERWLCSLTTGKFVRQYIYSGDPVFLTNFVVFVGDERVLYDVLLGGIIGASSGAMMGVLCVECGYRTVVLPIISELVHLQHGLNKFKTGKLVYSHSKIHSAIVGGIVSTSLAVQITETCSQPLNGGFYDATVLHVLGVFCMALIWKATRRDLVYGVYGAATVVVVQVLEDAMQVKDSQVILISTLVCAVIGALRIVKEFYLKGGQLRFPGTNVTEDITDSNYTIDYTSGLGFRLHFLTNPLPPGVRKCTIKVKCCLAGKHSPFIFPDDTVPVSGIYHIQSSHNVQSSYVLQLKHCVEIEDASQYPSIHIVYADSSFGPPYRFHCIKKGVITRTHAKVLLSKFSWFAIVADGTKIQTGVLSLCTLRHFAKLKQAPNLSCIFPPGQCSFSPAFQCSSGQCIFTIDRCDGFRDCIDGSDERNCASCQSVAFLCDNGQCVRTHTDRCDGFRNCIDGSDERNCVSCQSGAFLCNNGQCVRTSTDRCNGVQDCTDGSDEIGCTYTNYVGIIVGSTVASIVLFIIIPIVICVVIACCIAQASSSRPRTTVTAVAQPTPTTSTVVTTNSQQGGFQAYQPAPQVMHPPPASYPYPPQGPAYEMTTKPGAAYPLSQYSPYPP